jgi:hypothetical protein
MVMKKLLVSNLVLFMLLTLSAAISAAAPTISVWYGNNQSFGQIGNPQTAINILGNVSDPAGIQSLSYRLNGGSSINLSRGPNSRRLLSSGDFNIDIFTSSLNNGTNTVVITATNNQGQTSQETVTINYTGGNAWPLPYVLDWNNTTSINNVAQVVDGHWTLSGGTVRPTYLGYDRLVGIGNVTWTDYEVTVPITIVGIDPVGGFGYPSDRPGVGLLLRWTGHTDYPIANEQPKTGYLPLGGIGWFRWEDRTSPPHLDLDGNNLTLLGSINNIPFSFGNTYWFKMRIESIPGVGGRYKLKVWQDGQSEPSGWMIEGQQSLSDPQNGSVCLLSHHIDARFGTVSIVPLPPTPVQLSRFTAHVLSTSLVRLDWTTVSETNNYGFEIQKSAATPDNFSTIPNSFVPGHGTTVEPHQYSWIDPTTTHGTWYYRLKQIDLDGSIHYSDPVHVSVLTNVQHAEMPNEFVLHQNYPNPFNPSTKIRYEISEISHVTLKVFDVLGREVATLVNEAQVPGAYATHFSGENLPSGIYFYTLQAGSFTATRKLILMK